MPKNPVLNDYLEQVKALTRNAPLLGELFNSIPTMSVEHYQKTAFMFANKKYETEHVAHSEIAHGFSHKLENSIKTNGLLATLRLYDKELQLISITLHIDILELKNIIKNLRVTPHMTPEAETNMAKSRQQLRDIIRKFNSVYKENYIKQIIADKMALLEQTIITTPYKKVKKALTPEDFYRTICSNPITLKCVRNIIIDRFNIYPSETILREIILATTRKQYTASMTSILNIPEPQSYNKYIAERHIRRLENNFGPKLNKQCEKLSEEEKQVILKIIRYEVKCYELDVPRIDKEFITLKSYMQKRHINLTEDIARVLKKAGSRIRLENGQFVFDFPSRLTIPEKIECENYRAQLAKIKNVHNTLYALYDSQNRVLAEFIQNTVTDVPEEGNKIDPTTWLKISKIQELISKINIDNLKKMSPTAFQALKKFLIKDGLLWIYLADNLPLDITVKIINNFSSIYASTDPTLISVRNIQEIVKKANLYDYVDDFTIALIGLDNLSKIINYNQFVGVEITDEIIYRRIRQVVDLAIRAEAVNRSSLPFSCDIKGQQYSLTRYLNNDPAIFTCGIDTKTCFCVGVNENDFFFYSLLNKNGYIIKVTDNQGNLVARATCFRKNNVLMINGIRFINNKVVPESQEEFLKFKAVIDLIKLMAKKMITITSHDECPIDYVVCNQAGILENSYFDQQFEKINANLFAEPINIYDDDWQEFVHLYDNCSEQMLQEVPENPNHSFSTDFGNHYPAILIESRNNMGLMSPRNISLSDQAPIYHRPRKSVQEFIMEEITPEILAKINRIRALDYNRRSASETQLMPFKLIKNIADIQKICLGDDWCIIVDINGMSQAFFTQDRKGSYIEANQYMESLRSKTEKDVKLYFHPTFKD